MWSRAALGRQFKNSCDLKIYLPSRTQRYLHMSDAVPPGWVLWKHYCSWESVFTSVLFFLCHTASAVLKSKKREEKVIKWCFHQKVREAFSSLSSLLKVGLSKCILVREREMSVTDLGHL